MQALCQCTHGEDVLVPQFLTHSQQPKTSRMLNHKEPSDHRRHRYQDAAAVPGYFPSNPSPASVAMTQLVSTQPVPGDALRLDFVPGTEKTMMAAWGQIL